MNYIFSKEEIFKNILSNVRSDFCSNLPFETSLRMIRGYANQDTKFTHDWEELCSFVYKTSLNDSEILDAYLKYCSYEEYIKGKNKFARFFVERNDYITLEKQKNTKINKQKTKRYVTYSARGHFGTNNPVSAFLNFIAIITAYLLLMFIVGVAKIFTSIFDLFKSKDN